MKIIDKLTDKKIWIAPLAGITDYSYRTILKECGADILVSEMVSCEGLIYNKDRSLQYAKFNDFHRPFGIQLFGSNPLNFQKATRMIIELKPDFIDINMGCPVKKVVKKGAGSALLKDKILAGKIVKSVKETLQSTGIPLTVKIRSGWDKNDNNITAFTQNIIKNGADILIIHPRTRTQMFVGKSDWLIIKRIKEEVSIPVIGNGDIISAESALQMYQKTGCNSIMIGRGIIGKPWLIEEIKQFLLTGNVKKISYRKKLEIIKKHLKLKIENDGEKRGLIEMRLHLSAYTKGMKGGARARERINKSQNKKEIIRILEELFYGQNQ